MKLASKFHPRIVKQTQESYENPLLENAEVDFLSTKHVEKLRNQSGILHIQEYGEREDIPGVGELRHYNVETVHGYSYDVLVGTPETMESNIPVIGTSAWFTDTEGHNERVVRNITRAGSPVIFVGAEGSGRIKAKQTPEGPITLANSAASLLSISQVISQDLLSEQLDADVATGAMRPQEKLIDTVNRYLLGESRGGMTGMGVMALADAFGQRVLAADLTAPCLPRKLEGKREVGKLLYQIGREPSEMLKLVGKLGVGRLIHYRRTINRSRESLWHQIVIGGALFNGETGALARKVSKDAVIHMSVFENDFASMSDVWHEIFKNHPDVRITPLPGGHMTIGDYETLQFVIGRLKAFQICMREGIKPSAETIFEPAKELAQRQFPLGHEAM